MNKIPLFGTFLFCGFAAAEGAAIHHIPIVIGCGTALICCFLALAGESLPKKPWPGVIGVMKGHSIPVGPMAAGFVFARHLNDGPDILTFVAADGTPMATLHTSHEQFEDLANIIMQEDPKEGHTIQ